MALDTEVVVMPTLVGSHLHIVGVDEPKCAAHTWQTVAIIRRKLSNTWLLSAELGT